MVVRIGYLHTKCINSLSFWVYCYHVFFLIFCWSKCAVMLFISFSVLCWSLPGCWPFLNQTFSFYLLQLSVVYHRLSIYSCLLKVFHILFCQFCALTFSNCVFIRLKPQTVFIRFLCYLYEQITTSYVHFLVLVSKILNMIRCCKLLIYWA